jgi:hypothetical protein
VPETTEVDDLEGVSAMMGVLDKRDAVAAAKAKTKRKTTKRVGKKTSRPKKGAAK